MNEWNVDEHVRSTDPSPSLQAAVSMQGSAKALAHRILAEITVNGPGTQHTIALRMGLPAASVWKRLSDLAKWGFIEPTGFTMPGPSGRKQTVWKVKNKEGENAVTHPQTGAISFDW